MIKLSFYFREEIIGIERLSNLPEVTQLASGRAREQGQCWPQVGINWNTMGDKTGNSVLASGIPWFNKEIRHVPQIPRGETHKGHSVQFSSVQLLSRVRLFSTPWIAARQASLSITNSRSSLRLKSIESVMPSSHLILCRPLLLLPPIPSSIRVYSNESTFCIRWPKYWSFSFSISPSKEHPGLIFKMDWLDLLAVQGTLKSLLQHQVQKHQFFSAQPSSQSNSHIHTWPLEKP